MRVPRRWESPGSFVFDPPLFDRAIFWGMNQEVVPPQMWTIVPFALLLGAMALAPLLADRWWLRHYAKVSLGLGAIIVGYYLFWLQASARVFDTAHEYVSFIALVGSLFIVSGGI